MKSQANQIELSIKIRKGKIDLTPYLPKEAVLTPPELLEIQEAFNESVKGLLSADKLLAWRADAHDKLAKQLRDVRKALAEQQAKEAEEAKVKAAKAVKEAKEAKEAEGADKAKKAKEETDKTQGTSDASA